MASNSPTPPRQSETELEPEPEPVKSPVKSPIRSPTEVTNSPDKPSLDKPSSSGKDPESHDDDDDNDDDREVPAATESSGEGNMSRGSAVGSPAGSTSSQESGEVSQTAAADSTDQDPSGPPLPDEAPPLPNEQPPPTEDDGWDFQWDPTHQAYFFHNRFTNETTWDNPRLPKAEAIQTANAPGIAEPPKNERPPAGGYNPAIHGDYDPNAWYAKTDADVGAEQEQAIDPASAYAAIGSFNRFTGRWQDADQNPERHNDEAKSKRQMNAFFDVDAAANSHDGRSLKAERSGKKPSKAELQAFKAKRRARKEEKRRAWLRD